MKIKSIFTNGFGILASRILGFVRDIFMASSLGASIYSDMFFIAFKLPNLFRRIFAEGAFVQSFMPSFIASRNKSVFATAIMLRFLLFIILGSLLVTLFSSYATKALAIGFDEATVAMTAPLVAINFWYLDLIFLVTFLATLLQYKEHFATTSFSTALLNIAMIGALILYAKEDPLSIVYALSFSVLVGGLLQLLVHIVAIKKFNLHKIFIGGWKYHRKKDISKETSQFKSQFIPAMWGNSTAQISAFIDTWLASFLVSGSISYLYYANRLFQLPLALFAIATAPALFPSISKALKNGKEKDAYANLSKAFWILSFTLGFAMIGGVVLSEVMVELLFERGEFDSADTLNTAWVLVMYMVGLLPFGLAKLFSLFLYASQRQGKAAKIASISLSVNIALSLFLMQSMEAAGLALASSIGGWVLFVLTLKELGWHHLFDILKSKYSLYFLILMPLFTLAMMGINALVT